MIKMIASDLDGTLIPEGTQEMEPGFFEVLSELLDRGYQFYVATGRQYANVRRLFDAYADRIGFVCENGALAMAQEQQQYILEVPHEKAIAIAEDIMSFPETDICLSVTGIAGPGGGTKEKPVGTVFMGCSYKGCTQVREFHFQGNRARVREQTVAHGLAFLRDCMMECADKENN